MINIADIKKNTIAVIGLGYVGLPLCMALIDKGYNVKGIDYNQKWTEDVNRGISAIKDVPSQKLKSAVDSGRFKAYAKYEEIKNASVILICVPTPLNTSKEPDLSCINKAVEGLIPYIQKGTLISLESTTYPGTTRELIAAPIEKAKEWRVGKDFYVCYSPERVDPGNEKFFVENTPKVIGGVTPACLDIGLKIYESFLNKVVAVSSVEAAEMTKILENTFRCINIGLINELTMMCERMGIDIWEVIKGASSKPFGFMPFYPGPGVGGHCIPLDPLYLYWKAKQFDFFSRFIETATDINNNMPYFIVEQITRILQSNSKTVKDSKILLMGMSYKKEIGDLRESPSLKVYELLDVLGAELVFYDPFIRRFQTKHGEKTRIDLNEKNIADCDMIVILTDHSKVDYKWVKDHASIIYDTRNVYNESIPNSKIYKLGQQITSL